MKSKNAAHLEHLDHLRALAAVMVLLFHVSVLAPGRGIAGVDPFHIDIIDQGHAGVALFMVISGFILRNIVGSKTVSTPRFYLNRILRIYPLYTFVVALGFYAMMQPTNPSTTVENFLLALLPISNLSLTNYGLYGGQFWSVAVELQFYLLFPILLHQLRKSGTIGYLSLFFLLNLLRLIVYLDQGTAHHLAYFSIFGGLDAFLFGMISSDVYEALKHRNIPRVAPLVAAILCLAVIHIAFHRPLFFHLKIGDANPLTPSPSGLWVLWPTIQAAAFAAFLVSYLCAKPFRSSLLSYVGTISYSIYAWHLVVLGFTLHFSQLFSWLTPYSFGAFIVLPLTIVFAATSYALLERPFLDYRVTYVSDRKPGDP